VNTVIIIIITIIIITIMFTTGLCGNFISSQHVAPRLNQAAA